jgi:hypothetical protein
LGGGGEAGEERGEFEVLHGWALCQDRRRDALAL